MKEITELYELNPGHLGPEGTVPRCHAMRLHRANQQQAQSLLGYFKNDKPMGHFQASFER